MKVGIYLLPDLLNLQTRSVTLLAGPVYAGDVVLVPEMSIEVPGEAYTGRVNRAGAYVLSPGYKRSPKVGQTIILNNRLATVSRYRRQGPSIYIDWV